MPTGIYQHKKGYHFSDRFRKVCKERQIKLWKNPKYRENMVIKHTGKISYWKGKKRVGIGKNKIIKVGKLNGRWKGGITPENMKIRKSIEYRLWREAVFARDNWTCQKYGIQGGKLHPHHIYNFADYPELRFAIDNGITLSKKAHQEFHKIYGKRNNTKSQLEEFLK